MIRPILAALCLVAFSAPAFAADEEVYEKSLEHTRAVVAKHHLIALVTISRGQKDEIEFRYDRYPETERLQLKSDTYARKKGHPWLKSDDWAETGAKINPENARKLDSLISYVDAPLNHRTAAKDPKQGALLVELEKREPTEQGERLFYRIRRENSTNFNYPQVIFDKSKDIPDDQALLLGYGGLMYSGDKKVPVNITYSYMYLIPTKVEVAPPPPTETNAATGTHAVEKRL